MNDVKVADKNLYSQGIALDGYIITIEAVYRNLFIKDPKSLAYILSNLFNEDEIIDDKKILPYIDDAVSFFQSYQNIISAKYYYTDLYDVALSIIEKVRKDHFNDNNNDLDVELQQKGDAILAVYNKDYNNDSTEAEDDFNKIEQMIIDTTENFAKQKGCQNKTMDDITDCTINEKMFIALGRIIQENPEEDSQIYFGAIINQALDEHIKYVKNIANNKKTSADYTTQNPPLDIDCLKA